MRSIPFSALAFVRSMRRDSLYKEMRSMSFHEIYAVDLTSRRMVQPIDLTIDLTSIHVRGRVRVPARGCLAPVDRVGVGEFARAMEAMGAGDLGIGDLVVAVRPGPEK